MALIQYPLDKALLVAAWLEALVYGCLFVIFIATVYVNMTVASKNIHNRVMFVVSVVMFIIATAHLAMNCFRLVRGFIDLRDEPGGPLAYLGVLKFWDHIFKDTLYATQSILGDAVAVYRCWVLWKDWRVAVFPFLLLIASAVSGYMVCGLYTVIDLSADVFDPRLTQWITTFYSIAVAQNIITTGLMAFRLWQVDSRSSQFRTRTQSSVFLPILRILVESAALYLFVEILLLALYSVDYNAQYILLEIVTPIVGITFNAITIRINMRSMDQRKGPSNVSTLGSRGTGAHALQTVGSVPMRRIVVGREVEIEEMHDDPNDAAIYGKDWQKSGAV
ncbi:hypothetical protein MKEN_01108400 [Mycena kentingensis (nom. inval.)]|nr:hypothetical protein MKEN_01108400 [Mycena kentingensis (nom. inval.)]